MSPRGAASPAKKAVAIVSPRGAASPATVVATGVAARAVATGAAAATAASPVRHASKAAMELARDAVASATSHAAAKHGTRVADEARPVAANIVEQLVTRALRSPARREPPAAAPAVDPKEMVATILQGATVAPEGSAAIEAARKNEAKTFATDFVTNLLKEIPGGTPAATATPTVPK